MKRADIDDAHVVALAALRWGTDRENVVPDCTQPGVVGALIAEGIPEKLARSKVEHLITRGFLECGVSTSYAWPTPAGLALLQASRSTS